MFSTLGRDYFDVKFLGLKKLDQHLFNFDCGHRTTQC